MTRRALKGLLVTGSVFLCAGDCPAHDANGPTGTPGAVLWHVSGDGWAAPTVDAFAVFFPDMHHHLVAVEKQSGQVRWKVQLPITGGTPSDSITYGRGSVMAGGTVVAMDVALFGLDPTTGSVRWTFKPYYRIQEISLPSTDGQNVYAATAGGFVYALDGATGSVQWQAQVADSPAVAYNPVAAGDAVYAGFTVFSWHGPGTPPDSGGVFALDKTSGALKWIFYYPRRTPDAAPRGWNRVAIAGNNVIAPSGDGHSVFALDRATGSVVWQGLPDDLAEQGVEPVATQGNRVFVGFNSGVLAAFDAQNGRELWRMSSKGSVRRLMTDDQRVYAHFGGSILTTVDAATGKVLWQTGVVSSGLGGTQQPFIGILAAVADSDRVYGAGDQGFYAFRK